MAFVSMAKEIGMLEQQAISGEGEAVNAILSEIRKVALINKTPVKSYDHAFAKLIRHGMTEEQIAELIKGFSGASSLDSVTALADYEILHGLPYLDEALANQNGNSLASDMVALIFQSADICLYNLERLHGRMEQDVVNGNAGALDVKLFWCTSFHDALNLLGAMVGGLAVGETGLELLSVSQSPAYAAYAQSRDRLQAALDRQGGVAEGTLMDPRIVQQAALFGRLAGAGYQRSWAHLLQAVPIAGGARRDDEGDDAFYRRMTSTGEIRTAVYAIDLSGDTPYTQFRAYHQLAELCSRVINKWLCPAMELLAGRAGRDLTDQEWRLVLSVFECCDQLFSLIRWSLTPIIRCLTPKSYFTIRAGLGIISGMYSLSLRKGLFNTVYPLLVKVCRLRLATFDEQRAADDEYMEALIADMISAGERWEDISVVRYLVSFHQHIRVWRDIHVQLIKTQVGISAEDTAPTASVAGSKSAIATVDNFRSVHHKADPIRPIYRAVTGRDIPSQHPLYTAGGFDEYMSELTSRAVKSMMYADIQERVLGRGKVGARS